MIFDEAIGNDVSDPLSCGEDRSWLGGGDEYGLISGVEDIGEVVSGGHIDDDDIGLVCTEAFDESGDIVKRWGSEGESFVGSASQGEGLVSGGGAVIDDIIVV